MPFSLADVANDPDMGESAVIIRTKGQFVLGGEGWKAGPDQQIPCWGVMQPADNRALDQVPEGDRVEGAIEFITTTLIMETSERDDQISDTIQWNGDLYRVSKVGPWQDFGYYSAILVRMTGS